MDKVKTAFALVLLWWVCVLGWTACLGPLDVLGYESVEYEYERLIRLPNANDERIEDKSPEYDPDYTVSEMFGSCKVTLNKSGSVSRLDVYPFEEENEELSETLFTDREWAITELITSGGGELIPSLDSVNGAFRAFNDGLRASIETGMQEGVEGVLPSRRAFFYDLAEAIKDALMEATGGRVEHFERALVFVVGALLAGGDDVSTLDLPPHVVQMAENEVAAFEDDVFLSTPVGYYEWEPELREIYRQDRFSQNRTRLEDKSPEEFGRYLAMAAVMATADASELKMRYENYLAVYRGLRNPFESYTPVDLFDFVTGPESLDDVMGIRQEFLMEKEDPYVCTGAFFALFPPSRARDTDFFSDLFCGMAVPPGVEFMDVLTSGIRDEMIDLEPAEDSGWYDYQLHAMEVLLFPERGHETDNLLLTAAYKEKLLASFNSIIEEVRERHAKYPKGTGGNDSSLSPVDLYPKFMVEPFPSFYLRTARAYRFLSSYLRAVLGTDFLQGMYRKFEDGSAIEVNLADELRRMTLLSYGLFILSARSVGVNPDDLLLLGEKEEYPIAESSLTAQDWIAGWYHDRGVIKDPRGMVVVGHDVVSNTIIYQAVLGVRVVRIQAEFVEGYEPIVVSPGSGCRLREFVPKEYYLILDVMREVRIPIDVAPLSNEEFRDLCDNHDSADDIVEELEALR